MGKLRTGPISAIDRAGGSHDADDFLGVPDNFSFYINIGIWIIRPHLQHVPIGGPGKRPTAPTAIIPHQFASGSLR